MTTEGELCPLRATVYDIRIFKVNENLNLNFGLILNFSVNLAVVGFKQWRKIQSSSSTCSFSYARRCFLCGCHFDSYCLLYPFR